MDTRQLFGDRRTCVRMDVSGQLWASLSWTAPVVLRNISLGGALVEGGAPAELNASSKITLRFSGDTWELDAVIRRVSPTSERADETSRVLGLEFVNMSSAERVRLQRFIRARAEDESST